MVVVGNIVELFKLINYLFTRNDSKWILDLDDNETQPFVIQKFLMMNDSIRVQTRWLDKYVFVLEPKEYVSLAWSILPKFAKQPYSKYIKKNEEEEQYSFILTKIRKQFKLSDNDYRALRTRLIEAIKKDYVGWFTYYGVEKKNWKDFKLDFNKIKECGPKVESIPQKGLGAWGLG